MTKTQVIYVAVFSAIGAGIGWFFGGKKGAYIGRAIGAGYSLYLIKTLP